MDKKILKCILAVGIGLMTSVSVHALPLDGDLFFGGVMNATDQNGVSADWLSATGVNIVNDITTGATGDFAGAGIGLATDFYTWIPKFQFSDTSFNLFNTRGFTFELTEMNEVSRTDSYLSFAGFGTISGNGFDNTSYSWSFSADSSHSWSFSADSTGGNFGAFSSTLTARAAPVPEPSTMLLVGTGLIGIVGSRMRKKKQQ